MKTIGISMPTGMENDAIRAAIRESFMTDDGEQQYRIYESTAATASEQAEGIETLAESGAEIVIVKAINVETINEKISSLGLPGVVWIENYPEELGDNAFAIDINYGGMGREAVEKMYAAFLGAPLGGGEKYNIKIIAEQSNSETENGFREYFVENSLTENVEIETVCLGALNETEVEEALDEIALSGETDGIFCINNGRLNEVCSAVASAGYLTELKIITCGINDEIRSKINDGTIYGTVMYSFVRIGEDAKRLTEHLTGDADVPPEEMEDNKLFAWVSFLNLETVEPFIAEEMNFKIPVSLELHPAIGAKFSTSDVLPCDKIYAIVTYDDGSVRSVTYCCDYNYYVEGHVMNVTASYTSGAVTVNASLRINGVALLDEDSLELSARNKYYFYGDSPNKKDYTLIASYVKENGSTYREKVENFSFLFDEYDEVTDNYTASVKHSELGQDYIISTGVEVVPKPEILQLDSAQKIYCEEGEKIDYAKLTGVIFYSDGTSKTLREANRVCEGTPKIAKFGIGQEKIKVTAKYYENGATINSDVWIYRKLGAKINRGNVTLEDGQAGKVGLNLGSKKGTYMFSDYSETGSEFPVSVSHIHRLGEAYDYGVGQNWRLSVYSNVSYRASEDTFIYEDGRGDLYPFVRVNEVKEYAPEKYRGEYYSEELKTDLYYEPNLSSQKVTLADSNGNYMVFEKKGDSAAYWLKKTYCYPSSPNNEETDGAKNVIEYFYSAEAGQPPLITKISGAKNEYGVRNELVFDYEANHLKSLTLKTEGEETGVKVAEYAYSAPQLGSSVKKLASYTGYAYFAAEDETEPSAKAVKTLKFEYGDDTLAYMTATDVISATADGEPTSSYSVKLFRSSATNGNLSKVRSGYSASEYTKLELNYLSGNEYKEGGEKAVIKINGYKAENGEEEYVGSNIIVLGSEYRIGSYNVEGIEKDKISAANMNGVNYESVKKSYGDTLEVARAETTDDVSVELIVPDEEEYEEERTMYLMCEYKSSASGSGSIKVDVTKDGDTTHIEYDYINTDSRQCFAMPLGKLKKGDKAVITVGESEISRVARIKSAVMFAAPYETPSEIEAPEFDGAGRVVKNYSYNHINKKVRLEETCYEDKGEISSVTVKEDGEIKSRIEYARDIKGNVCGVRQYGKELSKFLYNGYGSEEESKSITIDENGIRSEVVYEEGKQTYKTGSGEEGSPEQIREAEYYKYGGIPKSITYGDVKNEYVYDAKCRISKLKCGEETYNYVYDDRDRVISVDKCGEKLVEYTYRGSDVSGVNTGNVSRSFTYDVKGRITEVKKSIDGGAYTEEMTAEYLGDAKDTVKITSGGNVTTTRRGSGKVLNEYESEDESLKMSVKAYVDEVSDGAVTSSSVCELYKVSNNEAGKEYTCIVKQEEAVSRDGDGKVKEVGYAIEGDTALFGNSYEYDDLGRLTKEKVFADLDMRIARIGFAEEYDYADVGSRASGLVKEQRLSYGNVDKAASLDRDKISYTYYTNGNVKSIYTGSPTDGKLLAKYGYDAKNRLVSESSGNETTAYAYDAKGNVTERKVVYNDGVTSDRTDVYTYSGDKLVSYNGSAVTYDSIGNPLSYMGKTFTWEGRRLKSVTSGGSTLDFAYNYEGMRTKKGNVRYFYVGNRLVSEVRGNVTILYRYGVKGLSSIVVKKGEDTQKYVCRTNIFGDVIAIYNTDGDLQCKYNYDAWGNHRIGNARNELIYDSATGVIATGYENHIAILNPIRYRGYYYDTETGLYYLQSRYYDATLCRFLNRDNVNYLEPESIHGLNLYAYCNNNPVMFADPSGHFAMPNWLKGLAIGLGLIGGMLVIGAVCILTCGVGALAGTMAGAIIYGAAQGIVVGAAVGAVGGTLIGGAVTDWSVEGMLIGAGIGFGGGAIIGGIIGGFSGASKFAANSVYITENGGNVKEVLSAFKGNPQLKSVKSNATVYRYWGGSSGELGHWVSPIDYGSSARSLLSLPASNTMTNLSSFTVNGIALQGKAAALFGQAGGGVQWWIGLI